MKEKNSKMGRPAKKPEEPNNIQMNIRISKEILGCLELAAEEEGISLPDLVRDALFMRTLRPLVKRYLNKCKRDIETYAQAPEDSPEMREAREIFNKDREGLRKFFTEMQRMATHFFETEKELEVIEQELQACQERMRKRMEKYTPEEQAEIDRLAPLIEKEHGEEIRALAEKRIQDLEAKFKQDREKNAKEKVST